MPRAAHTEPAPLSAGGSITPIDRHWTEETRWQPLGAVVQRLKRRVDRAIAAGAEFEGGLVHQDLVEAEWRLRQAERNRCKSSISTGGATHG